MPSFELTRIIRNAVTFAMLLVCAACATLTGGDCVSIKTWAIGVQVFDASTHAPITSGVTLILGGAQSDSTDLMAGDPRNVLQGGDVPGTYTVIVRHAGYIDFVRTGVHVGKSGCQPQTVSLTVLLQPKA